jgi:hypothetical protein
MTNYAITYATEAASMKAALEDARRTLGADAEIVQIVDEFGGGIAPTDDGRWEAWAASDPDAEIALAGAALRLIDSTEGAATLHDVEHITGRDVFELLAEESGLSLETVVQIAGLRETVDQSELANS